MTNGVHAKRRQPADWVSIVVVVSLPGAAVLVEDEVAGEEKDPGADLTALAHPVALDLHWGISHRGQGGWLPETPTRHYPANDAGVIMTMLERRGTEAFLVSVGYNIFV